MSVKNINHSLLYRDREQAFEDLQTIRQATRLLSRDKKEHPEILFLITKCIIQKMEELGSLQDEISDYEQTAGVTMKIGV